MQEDVCPDHSKAVVEGRESLTEVLLALGKKFPEMQYIEKLQ